MIVKVYMTAFGDGKVREVDVPDDRAAGAPEDEILELAFHYGQNDFQPRPFPSVSVGDVVELRPGARFRVASPGGFHRLAAGEDPLRLMGLDAMDAGYGWNRSKK